MFLVPPLTPFYRLLAYVIILSGTNVGWSSIMHLSVYVSFVYLLINNGQ
jgi:hypothetical protein